MIVCVFVLGCLCEGVCVCVYIHVLNVLIILQSQISNINCKRRLKVINYSCHNIAI